MLVILDPDGYAGLAEDKRAPDVDTKGEDYFYDRLPSRDSQGRWVYLCIDWPENYITG